MVRFLKINIFYLFIFIVLFSLHHSVCINTVINAVVFGINVKHYDDHIGTAHVTILHYAILKYAAMTTRRLILQLRTRWLIV